MSRISTRTHMKTKSKNKSRRGLTPEKQARKEAHYFGAPDGNPIGNPSTAANQREFYRWAETIATEKELEEYSANPNNPYARRKFVDLLRSPAEDMEAMFALTNQTHGAPKQPIEVQSLPKVQCEFFGNE